MNIGIGGTRLGGGSALLLPRPPTHGVPATRTALRTPPPPAPRLALRLAPAASPLRLRAAPPPRRVARLAATAVAAAAAPGPRPVNPAGPVALVVAARDSVAGQFSKLEGLWGKFIPMSLLFFLMAFINTIIDSLKDSLVITAVGGGTEVLPYLSVYGVLPCSILFLVVYSWGTQRFSRARLFNFIISGFILFYASFGLAYPHHEALHLAPWADSLAAWLPTGLGGLVGMARNWLFTLFYCFSELWGDVALSLLFWGLANETTSIEDAPLLYPLFGIGANVAQTMAGRALRVFSDASGVHVTYAQQLQGTIGLCVGMGLVVIALHAYIAKRFPINPKGSTQRRVARAKAAAAAAAGESHEARMHRVKLDLEATVRGLNYCDVEDSPSSPKRAGGADPDSGAFFSRNGAANGAASSSNGAVTSGSSSNGAAAAADALHPPPEAHAAAAAAAPPRRSKMTLVDAFAFLRRSPQIRCLAVMALAQGITTRLLDVTWKHYLHKLHATPAGYAAFLGDTAMWTGIVTGTLMFTSPMLFDRIGWRGVASATPTFMLWGGIPFFLGCIAYNMIAGQALAAGTVTLQALVVTGAVLQVLSKGAKFSLFKPAEEMVYIGLDDESRSKGKAAIDVVGAQSGKSIVSVMQQALLILTGGTVGGILPVLAVFYAVMLHRWNGAVDDLAEHYDPAHVHRQSVMASIDEDSDEEEEGAAPTPLPSPAAA